jgi:hypothetical protein
MINIQDGFRFEIQMYSVHDVLSKVIKVHFWRLTKNGLAMGTELYWFRMS